MIKANFVPPDCQTPRPGDWTWATKNGQIVGVVGLDPDGGGFCAVDADSVSLFELETQPWVVNYQQDSLTAAFPGGYSGWQILNGGWTKPASPDFDPQAHVIDQQLSVVAI